MVAVLYMIEPADEFQNLMPIDDANLIGGGIKGSKKIVERDPEKDLLPNYYSVC